VPCALGLLVLSQGVLHSAQTRCLLLCWARCFLHSGQAAWSSGAHRPQQQYHVCEMKGRGLG